jgi:hypothetical protein
MNRRILKKLIAAAARKLFSSYALQVPLLCLSNASYWLQKEKKNSFFETLVHVSAARQNLVVQQESLPFHHFMSRIAG